MPHGVGFVVRRWTQYSAVVVEREQLVDVVDDLRDGLAKLRPVGVGERFHRRQGVGLVQMSSVRSGT